MDGPGQTSSNCEGVPWKIHVHTCPHEGIRVIQYDAISLKVEILDVLSMPYFFSNCNCSRDDEAGTAAAYGQHPMADTERAELIPEQGLRSSMGQALRHKKPWRWPLNITINRQILTAAAVVRSASLDLIHWELNLLAVTLGLADRHVRYQ